jgi:hypothetical protein
MSQSPELFVNSDNPTGTQGSNANPVIEAIQGNFNIGNDELNTLAQYTTFPPSKETPWLDSLAQEDPADIFARNQKQLRALTDLLKKLPTPTDNSSTAHVVLYHLKQNQFVPPPNFTDHTEAQCLRIISHFSHIRIHKFAARIRSFIRHYREKKHTHPPLFNLCKTITSYSSQLKSTAHQKFRKSASSTISSQTHSPLPPEENSEDSQ